MQSGIKGSGIGRQGRDTVVGKDAGWFREKNRRELEYGAGRMTCKERKEVGI